MLLYNVQLYTQENYGCHFYSKAVNALRGIRESYDELFKRYDIIIVPTVKCKPPLLPKVGFTLAGKKSFKTLTYTRLLRD